MRRFWSPQRANAAFMISSSSSSVHFFSGSFTWEEGSTIIAPSLRGSDVHLESHSPHVPGGVTISSSSSSVTSRSNLEGCRSLVHTREPGRNTAAGPILGRAPSFSAKRAAAQAHSNVRFLPNSTYSRAGGLLGSVMGEEGILSQSVALGSNRLDGVRGAGVRSSDREATRSSEGLDDVVNAERLVNVGEDALRDGGWCAK